MKIFTVIKRHWQSAVLFLITFGISGCATMTLTDLFLGYSDQMIPMRQAWFSGDAQGASESIDPGGSNDTNFYLKQLEIGRLAFLSGHWEESRHTLRAVDDYLDDMDSKAQYRLSAGLQQAGTALTNDAAISYAIPAFEQVMMHHYQALNYLQTSGLESALVEVRRANQLQEQALAAYELDDESRAQQYQSSVNNLQASYPSLDEWTQNSKNAYQNAYTFVLSAVLYEADGLLNDAYIDYKKALAIQPHNSFLSWQVGRLGRRLGMSDVPQLQGTIQREERGSEGQVVVLYEQGLVPHRHELAITAPLGGRNGAHYYSVSLPVLQSQLTLARPARLKIGTTGVSLESVANIQGLAAWHLREQLPGMMLRQILRLVAKHELADQLAEESPVLGLVADLYNMTSERADTRSWQSLPAKAFYGAVMMKKGSYRFDYPNLQRPLTIQVKPGKITLVVLSDVGRDVTSYVYQF